MEEGQEHVESVGRTREEGEGEEVGVEEPEAATKYGEERKHLFRREINKGTQKAAKEELGSTPFLSNHLMFLKCENEALTKQKITKLPCSHTIPKTAGKMERGLPKHIFVIQPTSHLYQQLQNFQVSS